MTSMLLSAPPPADDHGKQQSERGPVDRTVMRKTAAVTAVNLDGHVHSNWAVNEQLTICLSQWKVWYVLWVWTSIFPST